MSDNYNIDLAKNIKSVLAEIGEDPQREGLIKTAERVAKDEKTRSEFMKLIK